MTTNDLAPGLLESQKARAKADPEFSKLLAEMRGLAAQEREAAAPKPAAAAPGGEQPQPAPQEPQAASDEGTPWFREAFRAVAGGAADAVSEVTQTIDEAATWLDNNLINLRIGSENFGQTYGEGETGSEKPEISTAVEAAKDSLIADNTSTAGQIGRSITQFLLPFGAAMKAMGGVHKMSMAGAAAKASAAGAITDAAAFDPHEKRLANLVMELSENEPLVGKAVFEYLQATPGDTAAEGRFKNALEGLALGVPAEGLFMGIRALAKAWRAKHGDKDLLSSMQDAIDEYRAENPDAAPKQADTSVKAQDEAVPEKAPRTADPEGEVDDLAAAVEKARAAKEAPRKAPRTEDPLGEEVTYERLQKVEVTDETLDAAAQGTGRKLWLEADGQNLTYSSARPADAVDFDKTVEETLAKDPANLSAEDLEVLRAYRSLQEKAFAAEGLKPSTAVVVPRARTGKVLDDKTRRAVREQAEAVRAEIDANAAKIKKLESRTDRFRGRGIKMAAQQGGFASPTFLVNLGVAGAGGTAGLATAPDDATTAERLTRAGVFAAGALGIKVSAHAAAKTLKDIATNKAMRKAEDAKTVQSLAKDENIGIAPLTSKTYAAHQKATPKVDSKKVDELTKAFAEGRMSELAGMVQTPDFNFGRIDSDQQLEDVINAFSVAFEKETRAAKGGTQSLGQIEALAKELGAGTESLQELYKGTANLGARVTAHRVLLAASSEHIGTLARHVIANPGDSAAILALRKHNAFHAALQMKMKGVQTEIGRALSSFRIQAKAPDLARNEVDALLQALGGVEANKEFARVLSNINDPALRNSISRKTGLARSESALFEGWVNGILSGFGTHAVNIVGNSMVGLFSHAEKGLAAVLGTFRKGDDVIRAAEVRAGLWGTIEGMKDALRINHAGAGELWDASKLFASGRIREAEELVYRSDNLGTAFKSFATDTPLLDRKYASTELDQAAIPGISSAHFGLKEDSFMGKVLDYGGALWRTPASRLLTTSDEFFKTALYRGELRAQAYRIASGEGRTGPDLAQRIADLLENPTGDMQTAALGAARAGTFTTPLGKAGQAFQSAVHTSGFGKYIVPFIRTPVNILKYVGVRTPALNLLARSVREEFKAGGIRRDIMMAKTAMGGFMYLLAIQLKNQGLLTGGGEAQQQAERLAGHQQYSLKIGDKYYSYNRLDPIGMFLGLAHDSVDLMGQISEKEADDLASAAMLVIHRNLLSKSYVKGMMDMLLAAGNPEMYGEQWVQRFAGSIVPSFVAQFARLDDPAIKEVWSVADAIKARIPGMSDQVPPHVNLIGEDVVFGDGLGPDIASPVRTQSENPSPLAQEIARMNVDVRHPPRSIRVQDGPSVDLDPWQYHRLMKIAGAKFKEIGEREIAKESYKRLPENDGPEYDDYVQGKQLVLKKLWFAAKQYAQQQLLKEDRDLAEKVRRAYKNKANALRGKPLLPINGS